MGQRVKVRLGWEERRMLKWTPGHLRRHAHVLSELLKTNVVKLLTLADGCNLGPSYMHI